MKAMILAAGRGKRMGELTANTPKPLLKVHGKPLIVWHLQQLAAQGIVEVVINLAYLGEQIVAYLGDGSNYGVNISYSQETPRGLETAGGIINALPKLGDDVFLLLNGDVYCDICYAQFAARWQPSQWAHLLLTTTPAWKKDGDFDLQNNIVRAGKSLTYCGIALISPQLFAAYKPGRRKLAPVLQNAVAAGKVSGEFYGGMWHDVGTPQRLAQLQ